MPSANLAAKGILDRVGQRPSWQKYRHGEKKETQEVEVEDHRQGIHLILDSVLDGNAGMVQGDGAIDAIGHRVVHGGDIESEAAFIDEQITAAIEESAPMAPLHNPPDLMVIQAVTAAEPS